MKNNFEYFVIKFLFLFYFLISSSFLSSRERQYVFRLIDATSGLSDTHIRSMTMTTDGYLAIKTGFVFNLYNGATFVKYPYDKQRRYLWNYNRPPKEYYDNKGRVWIKEQGYLLLFDLKALQYDYSVSEELHSMNVSSKLKDLFIDNSKNFWFLTENNTLLLYDTSKDSLRLITDGNSEFTHKYGVPIEIIQYKNLCWFVYDSGLIRCWDYSSSEFIFQDYHFINKISKYTDRISLHSDMKGNIWLMYNYGVYFFNRIEHQWKKVAGIEGFSNFYTAMDMDSEGNIWLGTSKSGLRIIDSETFDVVSLPTIHLTNGGILDNDISEVFADENGGVWIGTLFQGICYYHPSMRKFMLGHTVECNSLITNENIRCFYEDIDGNIYIAGSNGVFRFIPDTGELHRIFSLEDNDICLSVMRDKNGDLWMGTFLHGFYRIRNGIIHNYLHSTENLISDPNQNVSRVMYEDKKGNMWVSVTGGVGLLDTSSGKIKYMLKDFHPQLKPYQLVYSIYPLNETSFAALGGNGIYCYDFEKDSVWIPKALIADGYSEVKYFCMLKDSRGYEWYGSEEGLFILDKSEKLSSRLTVSDGLSDNVIMGLLEDDEGNIWASTLNGICKIELHNKDNHSEYYVTAYNSTDGLQNGKFYENSAFKTKNGMLFFGGVHGFNYFAPSDIEYNVGQNKPVLTKFSLFGTPLNINEKYGNRIIIDKDINKISEIHLHHDENFVTFFFSGLNYVNPSRTYYRYKLESYDKVWNEITVNGEGQATYTGLRPGKYTFKVYAANSDRKWSTSPAEITVIVMPPFWLSPLALVLYALVILFLMIYIILNFRKRTIRKLQKIKEENIRKQHEELDRMKLSFFTNISHELRTPLTLVLTPLGVMIKETENNSVRKKLELIYRNARRLLDLVNQLLDFRKLEMRGEKLELKKNDLVVFIDDIVRQFEVLAVEKDIEITFESEKESWLLCLDYDKIYKILNNLLSNAIKFTSGHGSHIRVILEQYNENEQYKAVIKVCDTGCGIPSEDLPYIFDKFYQAGRIYDINILGSGIGLHLVKEYVKMHGGKIEVNSTLGKGTVFTIYLPTDFLEDEAVSDTVLHDEVFVAEESRIPLKKKILIVEDNDEFRQFLAEELLHRFNVITAVNGKEAKEIIECEFPDLIISDLMMPECDGAELCRIVRQNIQTSHIPFILLTAKTSDKARIDGYEAGVDSYISKPFAFDVLLARIDQLIMLQTKRQKQFKTSLEVSFGDITTTSIDEKLMQKALESVKRNMDNPEYSVVDLSEDIGLSKTQLNRKIQSLVNMTPLQFIRSIRLKRAAQLLLETKYPVNEIADLTGFNTIKYFNQHFKEEFGMTPTQFREKGSL